MLRIKDRSTLGKYSPTKLQNANQAVKDRGMAVHRASVRYNVPLTTLRDRVDGRIHIDTVKSGPAPLFSQEEEAKLVIYIKMMAAYGYGYSRSETIMMASDFAVYLQKRSKEKPLTNQWYDNFMSRWPEEIKLVKPRALEASRAKSATKEKFRKPHCIFNIDENGFNTEHKSSDVVGDKKSTTQSVTSGRSQTVTVIAGRNAIGTHIPPFFVFPGKRMLSEILSVGVSGTDGGVSDSGWSNTELFLRYMQEHFIKYVPSCNADNPILVIYDMMAMHLMFQLNSYNCHVERARCNHIIIQLLPAHCSHFLQPLDVACFGPMQKIYNKECQSYMRANIGQVVTGYEICSLASKAYLTSLTPSNLLSSFKCTVLRTSEVLQQLSTEPEPIILTLNNSVPSMSDDNPEHTVVHILAEGDHVPNQEEKNENPLQDLNTFFKKRVSNVTTKKPSKPRKTLSKITSRKAVTEDENFNKITECVQQRQLKENSVNTSNKATKKKEKLVTEKPTKPKKSKLEKEIDSQRPSTSGIISGVHGPLIVEDSCKLTDSDDDGDNIPCCVCNQRYPPSLRHCISLTIVNWAQ
ncbi:unnamed protein product [Mytilus coruscus]|uniref:HTH psq-type domain-containing protein n=1 Tax=Mytilus coruscus TaxID=42192 RepID=A0A6J8A3F6_MYTCO|nr:unnamed protein product [Mytilus coruscus]